MHENIIKQQQILFLLRLRRIPFTGPRSSFIRRLALFLPCVEVIPEHTDRAARIKQSRVKMMRLKTKRGGGTRAGIRRNEEKGELEREGGREGGREREREKKEGYPVAGDENIEV